MLGIHVGTVFYILATFLGVSTLLKASSTSFTVIRYLGAAYLIWLGFQKLQARKNGVTSFSQPARASLLRIFCQGAIVNIFNPKTIIFFTAFLPQFIDQSRGSYATQLAFLCVCFIMLGVISDSTYALLSSAVAERLRRNERRQRQLDSTSGVVYIILGLFTALARNV